MTTMEWLTLLAGFVTNGLILIAGYVRMRERITKLETQVEHMLHMEEHLVSIMGKLDIRHRRTTLEEMDNTTNSYRTLRGKENGR